MNENTRYLLCEVIERDMSKPVEFDNRDDAVQAMLNYIREATGLDETDLEACRREDGIYDLPDGEADVAAGTAYATCHNTNYDWQIFEM